MRLLDISHPTPRVYIKSQDIQDIGVDENTILEIFDYLSTREIVDIVVRN